MFLDFIVYKSRCHAEHCVLNLKAVRLRDLNRVMVQFICSPHSTHNIRQIRRLSSLCCYDVDSAVY